MDKPSNNSSTRNNNGTGSPGGSEDSADTKKRKVWRTVNVSAGGGPPQAMTPEAAAKYIQQATANRGREVKISFGPSRPPTGSSQSGNSAAAAAASVSFGSLDLQALKESAAAAMAGKSHKGKGGSKMKDGLPCSEAEMKALMSMFVEIMGMSMDSDKVNISSNAKSGAGKKKSGGNNNGPMFMFGGDSNGMPNLPAGFADVASWEALRRTYLGADDENEDGDNSLPDLEEMAAAIKMRSNHHPSNPSNSSSSRQHQTESSGIPGATGIAPIEWESLEQVVIDDALETEELSKKAAKKKEKKQRKKLKAKEEAAQKAAEAAQKKREKAILSWRSRVVSACQSNEVTKLEALLQESPLRKQQHHGQTDQAKSIALEVATHLEFLLPNSIAKNRASLERGCEARERLADYILSFDVPIAFTPMRNGRTPLHAACFVGDVPFVKLVLEKVVTYDDKDAQLPESYLDVTCEESGWSPLHYAAVSGSQTMLETLLAGGCNVATVTDDTHTWRISDGDGVTSQELVDLIHSGTYENVLESHGVALQEMANVFFSSHSERRNFLKTLERVSKRLADVQTNGYSPLDYDRASSVPESDDGNDSQSSIGNQEDPFREQENAASRKRKKKKKKNQKQQQLEQQKESESTKVGAATVESSGLAADCPQKEEDPMVTLLLGMGFSLDQITAAAKACGGTNRATADDLVAWIFGQDSQDAGETATAGTTENQEEKLDESEFEEQATTVVKSTPQKSNKTDDDTMISEEEARRNQEEAEEAARRLAAKREETRRRNREWNNREQARQKEEAKAKMAKAMAVPQRPPAPAVPSYPTPAYPNVQSGLPNSVHAAASNPVHSGPRIGAQPGLSSVISVPPPVQMMPQPRQVMPPVQAAPIPHMVPAPIPIMNSNLPPHLHPSYLGGNQMHVMQPPVYTGPPIHTVSEPNIMAPPGPAPYNFHPVGDDDRTVSSYGSARSRSLSVSSNSVIQQNSVPPPGFRSASTGPSPSGRPAPQEKVVHETSRERGYTADPNPLGEIRATAKAFVPANFTPPTVQSLPSRNTVSGFAAGQTDATSSFHSGMYSSSSVLPTGLPSSSYDRGANVVTPITEVAEDPSAIVGFGGVKRSALMSVVAGSAGPLEGASGVVGASSLLDSLTQGPSTTGASSIWGGSGGGDTIQPAPPIAGLSTFAFGNEAATPNPGIGDSILGGFGKTDDFPSVPIGGSTGGVTGLGNWGFAGATDGTGSDPSAGQGSIW